jgi:hypothetical protein
VAAASQDPWSAATGYNGAVGGASWEDWAGLGEMEAAEEGVENPFLHCPKDNVPGGGGEYAALVR